MNDTSILFALLVVNGLNSLYNIWTANTAEQRMTGRALMALTLAVMTVEYVSHLRKHGRA